MHAGVRTHAGCDQMPAVMALFAALPAAGGAREEERFCPSLPLSLQVTVPSKLTRAAGELDAVEAAAANGGLAWDLAAAGASELRTRGWLRIELSCRAAAGCARRGAKQRGRRWRAGRGVACLRWARCTLKPILPSAVRCSACRHWSRERCRAGDVPRRGLSPPSRCPSARPGRCRAMMAFAMHLGRS